MERVQRDFGRSAESIAEARNFSRSVIEEWGVGPSDVVLVVSELATNAIRHAQSRFALCLLRSDGAIRIEVSDSSPSPAQARSPEEGAISGRGLMLVEKIARDWGFRLDPHGGKVVWADLELAEPS